MSCTRPYADPLQRLRAVGLRPTRQRLALAKLLFGGPCDRHVTAETLHGEAVAARVPVSLATVYNTLHQFVDAGLLREVVVERGCSYFDTNMEEHHHFFHVDRRELEDVGCDCVALAQLPQAPAGRSIDRVDIIIRVRDDEGARSV